MNETMNLTNKPPIVVSEHDFDRIVALLERIDRGAPPTAQELQAEIDRAQIAPTAAMAPDVVRIGSPVSFVTDGAAPRRVTLVFPQEADIAQHKVSILTPVGTALLGLSPGQSIPWTGPDGRAHELTVLEVLPPAS